MTFNHKLFHVMFYIIIKRRGERSREGEREKAAKERKVEGYRDE